MLHRCIVCCRLPPSFVQKFLPSSWSSSGREGSQGHSIAELPAAARRLLRRLF
jgi:hypothetical protein